VDWPRRRRTRWRGPRKGWRPPRCLRDPGIEGELQRDPGDGGHRPGERADEARRPPVKQHADHQDGEIVGVEARQRDERRLRRERLGEPAERQGDDGEGQDRRVLEKPGFSGRRIPRQGFGIEGDAQVGGGPLGPRRRGRPEADRRRQKEDDERHEPVLPSQDRLGKGDDAGDRDEIGGNRRGVGLKLGGRRGQAERESASEAEVGRRAGGTKVEPEVRTARDLLHQQAGEDQAQAPVQKRKQDRDHADEHHGAPRGSRRPRQSPERDGRRLRGRDHVAADRHKDHLHREGEQVPEAVAEGDADLLRRTSVQNRPDRYDDHAAEHEGEGIRKPALGEIDHPLGQGGARRGALVCSRILHRSPRSSRALRLSTGYDIHGLEDSDETLRSGARRSSSPAARPADARDLR